LKIQKGGGCHFLKEKMQVRFPGKVRNISTKFGMRINGVIPDHF